MSKRMLSTRTPQERDLADSRAKLKVTEKLRYPKCGSCGEDVTFWLPPDPPEPDAHGRPMVWAKRCEHCGAIVTALLEERRPEAEVHLLGEWAPFVAENFGHEPVVVQGRQHFRSLLREHGLRTEHESG